MTNPNNAVGTNGAYGGRTSVNAFNDDLSVYSRGIMSGWACSPSSGLVVALGGDGTNRDVAIAQDNAGNKTTINNISGSPISVTIPAAPASNSRIDSIVAYVDNPPEGSATVADNPAACGLIVVSGTAAANPTAPIESTIRSKITADGASGATAYYVVLANVTIASGTTTITSSNITAGSTATLSTGNLDFASFGFGNYSTSEQNTGFTWVDGSPIYKKTINFGALPNSASKTVTHGITNIKRIIQISGYAYYPSTQVSYPIPFASSFDQTYNIGTTANNTIVEITTGIDRTILTECYMTLYYTKTS